MILRCTSRKCQFDVAYTKVVCDSLVVCVCHLNSCVNSSGFGRSLKQMELTFDDKNPYRKEANVRYRMGRGEET
jgi:hypothetical protein